MINRNWILFSSATVVGTVVGMVMLNFIAVAQDDEGKKVYYKPKIDDILVGTVLKGEDGTDPAAEKIGAERFCRYKQYDRALTYKKDFLKEEEAGTMQWDTKGVKWWFCKSCTTYFKTITCQKGGDE